MTDILLQVLSNADLDWLIACGDRREVAAGDRLVQPSVAPDCIAVVIEGSLAEPHGVLQVPEHGAGLMDELGPGEIVGVSALLNVHSLTAVTALRPTQILSLPLTQLRVKLAEDVAFAAHLYQAIARMLANRLGRICEHAKLGRVFDHRPGSDVRSVFGELRDSDIDWLTAFGHTATIPADRVLLQAARPVESLYILLAGKMTVAMPQTSPNPIALCFWSLEASARDQLAFATLAPGSLPGMMAFLNFRPLPVTVRAVSESLVFAVPRQTLATKLLVDDSFASRFYRVVAMQMAEQLQTVGLGLIEPPTVDTATDDRELNIDDLHQISEGAKKFDWMLAQLGVNHRG
ncbi:cyclic nucleotide-binding domain-containing protein [Nodosilinea sp. PGN35]|uniref:cyclic nucleotide-binding domain-containing protein n=1 Tax=Nodosilinea sp. PGN35 TaxID=3020489 RepID=UPI0023B212F2|nr:cyclic nucleotide-binding domain-containing protein [Nodosilinea sp. TSF1-S3]MDF0364824.1 cyclic nucleotide-binding domain-containing protein [Nodosilinea sp. TSF1-S3]